MRLDVYHHLDADDCVISKLNRIEQILIRQGAQMALDFSRLEQALKDETDAEIAIMNLVTTLNTEIKAISAASKDPETQAKLNQLAADSEARKSALATATVAGTPAET